MHGSRSSNVISFVTKSNGHHTWTCPSVLVKIILETHSKWVSIFSMQMSNNVKTDICGWSKQESKLLWFLFTHQSFRKQMLQPFKFAAAKFLSESFFPLTDDTLSSIWCIDQYQSTCLTNKLMGTLHRYSRFIQCNVSQHITPWNHCMNPRIPTSLVVCNLNRRNCWQSYFGSNWIGLKEWTAH